MNKTELDYKQMASDATLLLQDLIRNKCVNDGTPDSGQEIHNVHRMIDFFAKFDIEPTEVFEPHEGRANLLIKFPGTDPKNHPSLMYQGHLDVVPANAEDWSVDPFAAEIKDGWLFGRGTIDMLLFGATQATAICHLVSTGWKPKGDLIFLTVADEEAGGNYGAKWLVENVPEKIKADFMISEGGGAVIKTPKGYKATVMTGEKGPAWTSIKVKGTPGHGSMPYGTPNALTILCEIVNRIEKTPTPIVISDEWKRFVKEMEMGIVSRFMVTHKRTLPLALSSLAKKELGTAKVIHSLTRMTVTPTKLRSGSKENIIPDTAELSLDIRMLPGQTYDDVLDYLKLAIGDLWNQVEIQQIMSFPGSSDPWDTHLVRCVESVYKDMYPDHGLMPLVMPGTTDSRFFRQNGTKCYGFTIYTDKLDATAITRMTHGIDESIPLEAIDKSAQFFAELLQTFW